MVWKKKLSAKDISAPHDFKHCVNVRVDPKTGKLLGLPKQWMSVVEFETLNRRGPLISTEGTTFHFPGRVIVGASASLSPSTSFCSGVIRNGSYTSSDTPIISPSLPRSIHSKHHQRSKNQQSIENIVSALKEMVEPTDPRNNLCEVGVLGSGSSSTVLQVYQTSIRRTMALKRMIIKTQQRPELLINELTVMKRCLHPNIIEFYGSYLVNEEVWILMECCRNSLTDYLMQKRLCEETIATVSKQCLNALSYLHSIGIIHRDLKSDSILFTNNWTVKLSDFGFAAILTDQFPKRRSLLGTIYWLAPEVANREFYGREADVWSFGITVIEMVCGIPPNYNLLPNVAIEIIKSGDAPSIPDDYTVSTALRSFVELMLVRDPTKRGSAIELQKHTFLEVALKDPSQIKL